MGFMSTLSRKLFIFQLIALFSFGATDAVADKHPLNVEDFIGIGNTYVIEQNFSVNRNLSSKGQVLFLTPGDAYRNMQAQRYQDWSHATVDSRNLYRVVKNDQVKIVGKKFNEAILEVELLTGPEKGRKYFAIKDDLETNFSKK
jgi:hypothetical protein